jgi:hypothetical protein
MQLPVTLVALGVSSSLKMASPSLADSVASSAPPVTLRVPAFNSPPPSLPAEFWLISLPFWIVAVSPR